MTGLWKPLTWFLIASTAGLVFVAGAVAGERTNGLHLSGRVTPTTWQWAREASANVPLPDARLTIRNGAPTFEGATVYLPFAWGTFYVHGLFLHELGHAYDRYDMTRARRQEFLRIAAVKCTWTAAHCHTARWVSGPGVYVDVGPQEMFAEMYAACALGLTEPGYQNAGYKTYGWVPPDGTDAALCGVIRLDGAT